MVALLTLGEGWHNYHHVFPWDYKAAELGVHFNISASFIRLCERLGLAWDLKTATPAMVTIVSYCITPGITLYYNVTYLYVYVSSIS